VQPSGAPSSTRELLLNTAERLFAEHGVAAVSNRQICEAAGQGNNYAVGYHFGSRDGLLTALLHARNEPIEQIRARMLAAVNADDGTREWLRCVVQPSLEYLGTSPGPTYFGVFCVQMAAMPGTTGLLFRETAATPSVHGIVNGLFSSLPPLPPEALHVRTLMVQNVLISTVAEFERSRNERDPLDTTAWRPFVNEVVEALLGLLLGPAD
jgi:AcrR family transcriptional regulator